MKIGHLNINASGDGINLDIDGSDEGIHIEYSLLPDVARAVIQETLAAHSHQDTHQVADMTRGLLSK